MHVSNPRRGRLIATAGLAAALVLGGLLTAGGAAAFAATAAPPAGPGDFTAQQRAQAIRWSATSPATHQGDQYRMVITNGAAAQRVAVRVQIMDHPMMKNTVVIQEALQLGPGELRILSGTNSYGSANHFQTQIASENEDLKVQVTLTDSAGQETARFTQAAFLKRTGPLRPGVRRNPAPADPSGSPEPRP